jgi:Zn-dependent protease
MGDETAMREGRISLNPLVHMDPFGTVIFPLVGLFAGGLVFGWAKPVPVQPRHFANIRQGEILTAGAGPFSNFLLAVVFAVLHAVMVQSIGIDSSHPAVIVARMGIVLNVVLGIFNLIPIPPLDGSHIASWGLPRALGDVYERAVRPYGFMILVLLLVSGALDIVFDNVAWPIIKALLQFGGGL